MKANVGIVPCIKRLSERLEFFSHYFNYIIIDTAPAVYGNVINEFTLNVVDEVVIPFDGSEAVTGLDDFMRWANRSFVNNHPNALFTMTKYQTDTLDIIMRVLEATGDKTPVNAHKDETRNSVFRIMKKVLADNVCDTGIPERRFIKNHTYEGLPNSYDIKKKLDKLTEEIIQKVFMPRENIFDRWESEELGRQIEEMMAYVELGRRGGSSASFTPLEFGHFEKVKSRLKLK
jgi:cellulose biosynthesis protein BcsQ